MEDVRALIDREWSNTCRTLLGADIGPLVDYVPYLQRYVKPLRRAPSALSGREVLVSDEYPRGTGFISCEEMEVYDQKLAALPLNLNDLKDLDSALRAAGERVRYAGNIILGNCSNIQSSNRVVDSTNVYASSDILACKNVAYCSISKECENVFGSPSTSMSKYGIKNFESWIANRAMETLRLYKSNDCYYCANLENCFNCLFCFNLRSKSRCIGNRPLDKDTFTRLRDKLVGEMREELKTRKSLPGIVELIGAPLGRTPGG